MTFLLLGIILNIAQVLGLILIFVFFSNLNSIDSSNKVVFSTIFILVFVFLRGLKLTYISRKKILNRLILISIFPMIPISFIFMVFDWFIALWIPKIDFYCSWGWLKAYFYFCNNSFLYHFVLQIRVMFSII